LLKKQSTKYRCELHPKKAQTTTIWFIHPKTHDEPAKILTPNRMSMPRKVPVLLQVKENVQYARDCQNRQECLKAIRLILDGEATTEQLHYFHDHLDYCRPCIENYNLEVTIRQLLCDRLERKAVSADVINSIRNKITEIA
jgi:hypothetical protein